MSTQIKFRRDTSTNWSTVNPRLGSGEPGLETDTGKVKIGDGSTEWNLLNYVFNGFVASYANLNVAQYLPTYTGNLKAGNVNAVTGVYSPAYFYSNGVAFIGGGGSSTYSNANVTAYLPTHTANVNATNLVGSTAVYAPAYYWANGAVFASSNYGNTQVAAYLPTYNGVVQGNTHVGVAVYAATIGNTGSTLTGLIGTNAQPYITSVGTLGSLGVGGTITATTLNAGTIGNSGATLTGTLSTAAQTNITSVGNLTSLIVTGNASFDGGQVTYYDSIIDLHTYANLAAWAADDGKDIGLRLHYYDGVDTLAFMGMENSSKSFQFLMNATETSGNVTGTFGNVQAGSLLLSNSTTSTSTTTGALQVRGGVGISGAVYAGGAIQGNTHTGVAVYAVTIGNTGSTLTGTLSTAAQTNITSVGTLTGLTSSGVVNITNGTNSTSSSTGALTVSGGIGVGGNVYVAGNIYASYVNYSATATLNTTAPIAYFTTGAVSPYNYEIGFYSNIYTASAYTGFVRNHVDNVWNLFSNISAPSGSAFNLSDTKIVYDTMKAGRLILANTTVATSPSTGALVISGGAGIAGDVYGNTFNGIAVYAGTIGNTGASLIGTVATAAQTSITSLGTLTSLGVTGAVQANTHVGMAVYANTIGNTGATIVGAIGTNSQPYITSLGTLTSLGVTGASTANSYTGVAVYAGTIGNTGSSLVGTLSTAAQTNITSVGTLTSLAVTGASTANSYTGVAVYAGTIGNTGATIVGTLSSATQTAITSLGTLTTLGVTGTSTLGAVTASTISSGTIGNSGASLVGAIATASQTNITSVGTLGSLGVGTIITAGTLNAGTIGNTGANFIGANVTASGNVFANNYGVYAGSYYWANGASFSGSGGGSSYSNTDVAGYLPTYTGNLKAGNLALNSNVTIAATGVNSSTYGEVQSNRMMGRYNTSAQNYFELTGTSTIDSGDATVASRIPTRLDTNSGSEILQPAYGAGYGSKKVGLGFHVGTQNDITAASVSSATSYAGNINAVVLGYMNNGPRVSLMDYSLVDDTANVMAFTSSTYKFYGSTGLTLATIDSSTKNITITGNMFGNAGTLQANTLVGSAVNAGTIGNTGAAFTGASIVTSSYSQSASYTTTGGGQVYAYLTGAIGANTANTGTFTSVTTTSGGQVTGYLTGAIGANSANAGTFTTLTATSASSTNLVSTTAFYSNGTANINSMTATTITAGTIGNSGAVLYGTINTASQPNITGVGTLGVLAVTGTISAGIHAGALNGSHNGTVGASTPNTGAFTTLTTTGDVTVAGNLYVNGNSTIINANNVSINDTLIYLANSNPANSYDIGFVGHFTAGTYQHTGVVRQASSNIWTFFSNVATEPTGNVLTFDSNTTYDTIKVGGIVWGNGASFSDSIGSAYGNTQVASYLTTYRGALTANNFNSTAVYAGTIGNTGASLVGTLSTAAQTNITSVGTLTGLTVSGAIIPNANNSVNLGSTSACWNNIYGISLQAKYADLAECYAADAEYAPGTVIDFGGTNEVTISTTDASRRVAGVVTTNPAYLMNSQLEAEFVAAVALQGRVPTLVQGPVAKGDTMVSAGNGRARAEADPKVSTVIGKALEDFDGIEGIIEVVVGRN